MYTVGIEPVGDGSTEGTELLGVTVGDTTGEDVTEDVTEGFVEGVIVAVGITIVWVGLGIGMGVPSDQKLTTAIKSAAMAAQAATM